ncbi:MAG: ribose-phosphate pyrophosphokinase [Eubacteriales bacterium]|nr:ribose-phosphate pyrophosphokinase [Eubacteriales bacterium]
MQNQEQEHGQLGLVVLESSRELGENVNAWLSVMHGESSQPENFIVPIDQTRFANGEGKIRLRDSVRAKDIYILCDVGNYGCTYKMFGFENHLGPDEHFQDVKRAISAIGGKASRVTLIMPLLYASRQHKRKGRESLDCSLALQELGNLGVQAIITFDAHDPSISNAIPLVSFENIFPTYTILKNLVQHEGHNINKDNFLVISPDTGAMDRAIYYANVLGLDVGMFYKRRDHSVIVDGKNPIIQHEYIGRDVQGKDILIVDDMIASGESVLDIIKEVKRRGAARIFVAASFAFFTEGTAKFQEAYDKGYLTRVYTTNLSHIPDSIRSTPWCAVVDMSKFIAKIIHTLHADQSISPLLNSTQKIKKLLETKE